MILHASILSLITIFVQLCSGLDIRWYSWLDGSQVPEGLNLSACGMCQEQMLKYLDEIHQDVTYANKTINIDKISTKLSQRSGDLESAFSEHATGYKRSSETLNSSINMLASRHSELTSSSDLGLGTSHIIDGLEATALNSKQAFDCLTHGKLKAQDLSSRLNLILDTHRQQLDTISWSRREIFNIERHYRQQANHTHRQSLYGDLVEHSAKQLELLIDQSNRTLHSQAKCGIQIDSVLSKYVSKLHHLTNITRECEDLSNSRLAHAVFGKLSSLAKPEQLHHGERLEEDLMELFAKSEARLNASHVTSAHLADLRQSVSSNDEREADERLVLLESHKDTKNLLGKLDKLAQRLKASDARAANLKLHLDKLESLDQSAMAMVKNLTAELSQKNTNISRWYDQELNVVQIKLAHLYEQTIENFHNETRQLADWTDILELNGRIKGIMSHLYEINTTMALINATMNLDNFLVSSQNKEQVDWPSKDLIVVLLNTTKSLRLSTLLAHESQVNELRQQALGLTPDLDQARVYQSETRDIMKHLDLSRSAAHDLGIQAKEKLTVAIEGSTTINDYINTNLRASVENVYARFSGAALKDALGGRQQAIGHHQSDTLTAELTHIGALYENIRFTNEDYNKLNLSISNNLNATQVVNRTRSAQVKMRESLNNLRNKVYDAKVLLNQLKLGRTYSTVNRPNISAPIGAQLSLPYNMTKQSSSYISISFLIKLSRADTNELALLVSTQTRGGQECHAKHILVKVIRGHPVIELKLGQSAATVIRDDEQLEIGRTYRVVVNKIGVIVNISIQSNLSTSSMTRTLSGPYITFDVNSHDSEVFIGGVPTPSERFGCFDQRNMSSFSGQMQDLEINGHKLGLWNTQDNDYSQSNDTQKLNSTRRLYEEQACEPLLMPADVQHVGHSERYSEQSIKQGRLACYPRPKSNISSSFIQILHSDTELDKLLAENNPHYNESQSSPNLYQGHIHDLTVSFKTNQTNGLILHHARPDHSSFLSIYISGGRLMLAFNFDKKIRFESHFSLSDGQWHHLNLILHHNSGSLIENLSSDSSNGSSTESTELIRHNLIAILDDRHLYHEEYNLTLTRPVNLASQAPEVGALDLAGFSSGSSNSPHVQKKLLYFGGLEDKYSPLLRSQQISTNFHGCLADVTINKIWINLANTNKSPDISLGQCELD